MNKKKEVSKYRLRTGERLRKVRKSRGLTQEMVAEKVGVTTLTIGRMEREGRFSSQTLFTVLEVLECDYEDIFYDENEKMSIVIEVNGNDIVHDKNHLIKYCMMAAEMIDKK